MADATIGLSFLGAPRLQPTARTSTLEALEAGLPLVQELPEGQQRQHLSYYREALDGIQALRSLPLSELPPVPARYSETPAATGGAVCRVESSPTPSDWSSRKKGSRHSNEFGFALEQCFDKLDADRDGLLTIGELDAAMSRPDLSPEDTAAVRLAWKYFEQLAQLSGPAAGQGCKPKVGISRQDLASFSSFARHDETHTRPEDRDHDGPPWYSADEYRQEVEHARREKDEPRLLTGKPTSFTNSSGKKAQVTVTRLHEENGVTLYRVQLDRQQLEISAPTNLPCVAGLVDMLLDLPPESRARVKRIEIVPGKCPENELAKAVDHGDGTIRFFQNGRYLDRLTFFHEVGHEVGRASAVRESQAAADGALAQAGAKGAAGWQDWGVQQADAARIAGDTDSARSWIPPGWENAMSQDGGENVGGNAVRGPGEDFAETWSIFLAVARNPDALAHLRRKMPHRVAILERLYQQEG